MQSARARASVETDSPRERAHVLARREVASVAPEEVERVRPATRAHDLGMPDAGASPGPGVDPLRAREVRRAVVLNRVGIALGSRTAKDERRRAGVLRQ